MKKISTFIFILFVGIIFTGCISDGSDESSILGALIDKTPEEQKAPEEFSGEQGEKVVSDNGKLQIEISDIPKGEVRYFNTELTSGKKIYFFIVKDKNGVLRAAANACQVCHASKLGFSLSGNSMECKTCGNKYPLEKISTEKGGCNPGPINPNLKSKNDIVEITEKELEQVADLF